MAHDRCILHADMDAFYAAIEQRDDPALRGRPVVVGGSGRRGVVSTASYEARRFGVHSAMPGAEARRRCPDAVFVPPRMDVYMAVSAQVQAVFESVTPLVEPLSLDEAFLDVTGSSLLFGDGRAIAERLRAGVRDATGLAVSTGVASCKFVAKVASDLDKPDGLVVVPGGGEREFLAPLPVRRLWGAGKITQERFAALGLASIGDVQAFGLERLCEALGDHAGLHFWRLAIADDPRPVVADREAKSISHECTFDMDVDEPDVCRRVLLEQAERVGRRLRNAGLVGHTVKLKLRFPPFETLSRQRSLAQPTDDDLEIHRVAAALFDAAVGGRPVRLIGVGVSGLQERGATGAAVRQGELFAAPETGAADRAKHADVLRALDAIRDRFGDDAIGHGMS